YISKPDSAIYRPIKELKGFAKTYLAPGEETEVFIGFDEYTFRVFDRTKNAFVIEAGTYVINIGASFQAMVLSNSLCVDGVVLEAKDAQEVPSYFALSPKQFSEKEFAILYGNDIPKNQYAFLKRADVFTREKP
ncbi:MAG: glycosyl hydrolase, partial [Clostridia bacterium]|nr:glycosyl hydrolase [Clostridia bacterium]